MPLYMTLCHFQTSIIFPISFEILFSTLLQLVAHLFGFHHMACSTKRLGLEDERLYNAVYSYTHPFQQVAKTIMFLATFGKDPLATSRQDWISGFYSEREFGVWLGFIGQEYNQIRISSVSCVHKRANLCLGG